MEIDVNKYQEEIESRFNDGHSHEEIKSHLMQLGFSEEALDHLMRYYRLLRSRKQQRTGLKLLALGALMCLSSCLLTLFHDYSDSLTIFTLYGITMVGACVALVGLALVFGL